MKKGKQIILAFSGGLDTSFSIPYLQEQGFEVITVTVETGGYTKEELKSIAEKSKKFGAIKHIQVDGMNSMFNSVVEYIIKTNGLYQGSYPNMCTDRYIIAEEVLKVAHKLKVDHVAHGSSAMGNDQVRFDVALMTLDPNITIHSPIKEMGGNRQKEMEFLKEKGFEVPNLHKKYSVNQNVLGITYSGSEIDELKEPDESMFIWTKPTATKPIYITIKFDKGVPCALDGVKMSGETILQKLNKLIGQYGYGRGYYTGDCVIGIKGHIVFEAPGVLALITAHKALEQLVLTKPQQTIGAELGQHLTDLFYTGKFFEPVVANLKSFFDAEQSVVSGEVKLKVQPNQVLPVAISSPFSLIKPDIASYAQSSSWSAVEADGFIKLYGLQGKIAAAVHATKKE